MKGRVPLFLFTLVLFAGSAAAQTAAPSALYFARWNITHGRYLIDVGKYLEALESFETAIESITHPHIQAETHLEKANLLALFLDDKAGAVKEYEIILKNFPTDPLAETALYRLGLLYYDQANYEKAISAFSRYLKSYPQGKFRHSAEFLLGESQKKLEVPAPPPPKPELPTHPVVRVRLQGVGRAVTIKTPGKIKISDPLGKVVQEHTGTVTFTASSVIQINGTSIGLREVQVAGQSPLSLKKRDRFARYRGVLQVSVEENGLQVINRLGIEEYLYGVVPAESYAHWPLEALKAQAIAARTYALYQVTHRQQIKYDLVDDEGSQAYKGMEVEHSRSNRAVDDTRGIVLAYGGKPILAMYTANTGWYTADPAYIFNQGFPYLTAHPDPYSVEEEMGRWTRTHSAQEIQEKLTKIGVPVGVIFQIRPHTVDPSGRIIKAEIVHSKGSGIFRARTTLKRALGLPEVLLAVERDGKTFRFDGGGFGHGVGYSQWGGKHLAERGGTATQILSFYYPNTQLARLW